MAQMFPEFFPGELQPDNQEYLVFQTLRTLPDSYSVFYSKKFKGGLKSKEECEVDFLVFDGKSVLLCVEVKGGVVQYDGQADAWFQNDKPLLRGPDRQASAATHAIIDYLRQFTDKLSIGWCLCFPNCSLPPSSAAPSGIPRSILIDEGGLLEPAKAISLVESYYRKQFKRPGLKPKQAAELVRMLTRGLGFVHRIGVRVARDRNQLIEVTKEQFNVLEDLMVNSRIAVRGVAGSGKTLLAQEYARRLAVDGKKVLLLFFNRMISNSVRYGIDRELDIHVTTFHSFAKERIEEFEPDWWSENKSADEDFWNLAVPMKLADCVEADELAYDAIIVDEGQDFKRTWFEILEPYSLDRFAVFYDEAQDIFGRWDDLPWGAESVPKKVLSRNCRNTKSIVDYLSTNADAAIAAFEQSPQGVDVVEKSFATIGEQAKELKAEVSRLLKGGVEPGQVVIVLDSKRQDSALANINAVGATKIEAIGRTFRPKSNSIRYTNISLFKGLEADIVFLLYDRNKTKESASFYTSCSRATTMLYVYSAPVETSSKSSL